MRKNYLVALQQAKAAADANEAGTLDAQGRLDAVIALAEWGVFSARNVALFTGMKYTDVLEYISNPTRKGGRVTVAAIPHIIRAINLEAQGKFDVAEVRAAVDAGTSLTMFARLTGQPHTSLFRRLGEGKKA